MKRFQLSCFGYYISDPAKRFRANARRKVRAITDKLTGRWWCDGCNAYHHGRVYAFSQDEFLGDPDCGLHMTAEQIQNSTIKIGGVYGRNIAGVERDRLIQRLIGGEEK